MPWALPTFVFHFSVARALLPFVWKVGTPVAALTSQGCGDALFETAFWHPGGGAARFQHQSSRVSVEEWSSGGEAGKTFQAGLSAAWSTIPSRTSSAPLSAST